ncbi:hypothetical protein Y032_0274g1019 [Ancylostoma ceylanicum]|uniref:Uncharacterized protein n=1 Tax=Ancylostoma ceylanicum TaxID=53326 RepID=A0A016S8C8_9BILA|nr:hypothetical protein Y032_0274g1019 [Ancylostoma ceylanicum]
MALPLSERCLPDYISAGTYERVVEEVPDPILAMYLQALSGALWKNSTIPLWKNATPPSGTPQQRWDAGGRAPENALTCKYVRKGRWTSGLVIVEGTRMTARHILRKRQLRLGPQ